MNILPPAGTSVILANGRFPETALCRRYLTEAQTIICCDGAVEQLVHSGLDPDMIVGDLDSISDDLQMRYADRIQRITEQQTNDLTKAILWAAGRGIADLVVLGADGKRLDHTIGNAGLMAEHCDKANLAMLTDEGWLVPARESATFASRAGQQVSLFSIPQDVRLTSTGLKYPLVDTPLDGWWLGTLNESLGETFTVAFDHGTVLVFLCH